MILTPGDRLGPYEIVAPLGAGGMGEVYRATDTRLRRIVALKVLTGAQEAGADARRRLEREARASAALDQHPHICAVYDIGHDRGIDYFVMPYVDGDTLADRLKSGALPVGEALEYARQAADALAAAHRQGVVHRDVKPANIKLTPHGIKLLDFGVAVTRAPSGLQTTASASPESVFAGTIAYTAPEALERLADERSDVFSLGAVLHEALTGQRAFAGDTAWRIAASILNDEPPPVSSLRTGVPPLVDSIVARALAKQPDARWQSAAEFRAAIETCLLAAGRIEPNEVRVRETLPSAGFTPAPASADSDRVPRTWPIWATVACDLIFATLLLATVGPLFVAEGWRVANVALPVMAAGLLAAVAGVGVFLWRPWGRRAQQALAAAGLLLFPVGTVLGAAALSYFARPGVKLLFADIPWGDLSVEQRARARRDATVPRRWLWLLPVAVAVVLVPAFLVSQFVGPNLLRARIAANEIEAVAGIRSLLAAESTVAGYNHGFFVPAECLLTPQTCLPSFAGGQLVDAESYSGPVRRGYRWQMHAGPPVPPDEIARAGASARSLQAVAITMVPNEPGRSGVRSFCGDTSGQLCFVVEGLLRVEAGRCLECRPVQ